MTHILIDNMIISKINDMTIIQTIKNYLNQNIDNFTRLSVGNRRLDNLLVGYVRCDAINIEDLLIKDKVLELKFCKAKRNKFIINYVLN